LVQPPVSATYRLAPRDGPGDPGEPQRVAERLQIQQHDPSRVVVGPVAQKIVAAHVDLVAHRHERRDADVAALCLGGDGDADAARLRPDGDPPRTEALAGERGVEATSRRHHAEAIGPDDTHPVTAGSGEQLLLVAGTVVVELGEPRGHDDRRRHTCPPALVDHVDHRGRRNGDHGEVGHVVEVGDMGDCRQPGDPLHRWMDDVDASTEGGPEVVEDSATGLAGVAAGADDHHVTRAEDRFQ
jgi:hypothetical protein